jgi:antibiotic biosynthesis monooxygenase (ABM) superfamily enzyme
MPTALFTVKATIAPEREKAFNEWYNHEHIPDVFKFKGVVSARRYKATAPEDQFQYVTMYEFGSEETLERFLASSTSRGCARNTIGTSVAGSPSASGPATSRSGPDGPRPVIC